MSRGTASTDAMMKEGNSFCRQIGVEASPENLREVRRFVEQVSQELQLEGDNGYDLKVAVSEAAANAIEHSGAESFLEVCATQYPDDRLTFEISDEGNFHLSPRKPEQAGGRGLGLPLMVALMDEVRIYRNSRGGTTVSLTLFLGGQ